MSCSCLMQSWLSWRRLCPFTHTHTHTQPTFALTHTHSHTTIHKHPIRTLSSNTQKWTHFDTFSHQNPLIHTWTRLIKALPYQLHSNGLQQQELTETSNSALYDTASNEQGTKCFLRWNSSWGWLAGRATGHRPTLRKWEKPLWGWSSRHWVRIKQKTAEGFFFFTTSVELPNHLTFFFLTSWWQKAGSFWFGH